MIEVKKVWLDSDRETWRVFEVNGLPITPIQNYLKHLEDWQRSPSTVRTNAYHLKIFWQFLLIFNLQWEEITRRHLVMFVNWLCNPEQNLTQLKQPQRLPSTINSIIETTVNFYRFQQNLGAETPSSACHPKLNFDFLDSGRGIRHLKLREPRKSPILLTPEQVELLENACLNLQSQLLIRLLYTTRLMVGKVLELQHRHICQFELRIVNSEGHLGQRTLPREKVIPITEDVYTLFCDYLTREYPDGYQSTDYIFLSHRTGTRLTYSAVNNLFKQLRTKTGLEVNSRILRNSSIAETLRVRYRYSTSSSYLQHFEEITSLTISSPSTSPKIPKCCNSCRFLCHDTNTSIFCAVHPEGPGGNSCSDFSPDI